ncbi:MAG TPA: arginase family protein [Candidatus Polarisedimenticolia bacterium]|nr:arginase family protein [Candidatus Polarisedimenticolia bacterium]
MKLSLLGVPSSAGAQSSGIEKAPAALRGAGLAEALRSAGCEVEDRGDQPEMPYAPDPDPVHRKYQNLEPVLEVSRILASRVESVLREGRIPLVLGGDCTIALGCFAGAARFRADLGLVYLDRDADLNTPATTRSGILHGMVLAHLLGRGLPELSRLGERFPLLRPGRLALLGADRLDPAEVPIYEALPSYRIHSPEIRSRGPSRVAVEVLERVAGGGGAFFVHFDVDAVDGGELPATDFPAPGGLALEEARLLLSNLVGSPGFAGIDVTEYNPEKDPQALSAAKVVETMARILGRGDRKP